MRNSIRANPDIKKAAQLIAAGEVVAYPTEAVWGLGCDPFDEAAVQRILQLKQRPVAKGVILIASAIGQFDFILAGLVDSDRAKLEATWPGPFTWLVPHQNRVLPCVHGQFETVALRVSAHPTVQALCQQFGGPIVSTSANPQAMPPAREGWKARQYFGESIGYCPGVVGKAKNPTKIQDLSTGAIIRAS